MRPAVFFVVCLLLLPVLRACLGDVMTCGDGYCDDSCIAVEGEHWEDCASCPQDCACNANQTCAADTYEGQVSRQMGCVYTSPCGDGECESDPRYQRQNISENCVSCPADCTCDPNFVGPYGYCGVTAQHPEPHCVSVAYCGDGTCDYTNESSTGREECLDCPENCVTCPQDCNCNKLNGVQNGIACNVTNPIADRIGCFYFDYCGNNYCGWGLDEESGTYKGETCKSCPHDCACTSGEKCEEVGSNDRFWDPPDLCINTSSGTSLGTAGWRLCPGGSGTYCHQSCPDGYCDQAAGETCATCADCACGAGEHCDPNSNSQDSKGCVAGAAKANVTGTNASEANASENVQYEICTNGIDDDGDGLVDCADAADCSYSRHCSEQLRTNLSQEIKEKYLEELKRLGMDMHTTAIETYAQIYGNDPEKMVAEMNKYMNEKVYKTKQTEAYLSIFKNDPQKLKDMQTIIDRNQNDLIMRDIEMQEYISKNSKDYKDEAVLKDYVENYVLNPPKWLYGGQYNSGGLVEWTNLESKGFVSLTEAMGGNPPSGIKIISKGTTVIMAVYDAKDLLDKADTLKGMQIDDNTKVGVVVLDGALKIVKLVDPTGYFGNLGDATVGKVIQVGQQIEERRQGCVTWNGKLLCQQADGSYIDELDAAKPVYDRVGGGWFGTTVYVQRQ